MMPGKIGFTIELPRIISPVSGINSQNTDGTPPISEAPGGIFIYREN